MGKPPKLYILIGFSIISHPFWGTIICGNTQILLCVLFSTSFFARKNPRDLSKMKIFTPPNMFFFVPTISYCGHMSDDMAIGNIVPIIFALWWSGVSVQCYGGTRTRRLLTIYIYINLCIYIYIFIYIFLDPPKIYLQLFLQDVFRCLTRRFQRFLLGFLYPIVGEMIQFDEHFFQNMCPSLSCLIYCVSTSHILSPMSCL